MFVFLSNKSQSDCWLEVSAKPEGFTTGQTDRGYPKVFHGRTENTKSVTRIGVTLRAINTLNAELNHICQMLALLGAHPILHVSRIRVNVAIGGKKIDFKKIFRQNATLQMRSKFIHDVLLQTQNLARILIFFSLLPTTRTKPNALSK